NANLQVQMSANLKRPMVAVGAPVDAYFPDLADRLQTELYLPRYAEVANAVGTVSGKAVERVSVLVKPGEGGGFLVHTPIKREFFMIFDEAIDFACKEGQRYVYEQAVEAGASNIETLVERHDRYSKLTSSAEDDNLEQKLFIESTIEVSAVGRPWSD
ncbi:MAG: hydantoinase/oxoprolinase family protein, partial [Dethiobacteria bacterium]|nr:hydantoinase/oxoprolinase family protein [Dethiobacteria bacterium]